MSWREVDLADGLMEVRDRAKEFKGLNLPYIGLEHIEKDTLKLSGTGDVREVISDKTFFKSNDILFGTLRPYFRKVYFAKFEGVCSTDITVLRSKNSQKTHPRFFFYFIANKPFIDYATSTSNGTRMPRAKWKNLIKKPFWVPDYETQHKIASILSAYDDLIENNMRRIKLLEEAARLIYKEWFVRLRFPGHEHIRVVDGVPDGWIKKAMDDVCESVGGGTPSTKVSEYWDNGNIIWITPTDVTKNNCIVLLDSEKKITEEGLKKSSAKLVPPDTILMTSRASIGFFALIDKEVCTNQGFISIIPSEENSRMYLLFNLIHRKEEIISKAGGTTYKEIIKSTFRNFEIMIPSKNILNSFNNYAYNFIRQVRLLKKQNQKLKEAHDILLPRLMNGSIQV